MRKLSLVLALCMIFSMMILSGCNKDSKIYFYTYDSAHIKNYQKLADGFANEYNADESHKKIDIVVKAIDENYMSELKNALNDESSQPDIFMFEKPNQYSALKDYCADISDTVAFVSELICKNLAVTDGSKAYALPLFTDGFGLIYNERILEKYFHLESTIASPVLPSSVEEINSFEALKAVVYDIQSKKDELGINGAVAPLPLKYGYKNGISQQLAGIPLYYEFETDGEKITDNAKLPEEIQLTYANELKAIIDLFSENTDLDKTLMANTTYKDSAIDFARGNCVFMAGNASMWQIISQADDCRVTDSDVSMMPLYMGIEDEISHSIAVEGHGYIALNKSIEDNKADIAKKFIDWMLDKSENLAVLGENVQCVLPYRLAENDNPLGAKVIEYASDGGKKTLEIINSMYPSEKFRNIMNESILDYVQGVYEWEGIVATATDAWKK